MKRRVDFVSNSSSSSFVVVVSNDMSLDTFCKKFADLCMTKTTSDDVNMRDQNIVKLRYCLSENVLLHLGQLYIRNAESVFDEDHCEYCGEEMSDEYREYWKSMVNDHKHAIAKFNEAKDDPSLDQYRDYEMYKDDYVDEDGKVHIIEQVWSGKHAVSRHMITTSIAFNRHEVCNDADFDEDMLRTRI